MGKLASLTAVVIAAYNSEATLERAVRSALAQPEAMEICVVDDASTDGTRALAQELAAEDARVIVVSQPANGGPSPARNAALAATRAPWIAILDADDYMLPGRLTALHAHAAGADFVADMLIRTPEGGEPKAPPSAPPRLIDFTEFVLGNTGGVAGPLDLGFVKPIFRRDFLTNHRLRYRPEMRLGEDYEFYARALALGARFRMVGPAGYVSVERPGSLSRNHTERDLELLRDCNSGLAAIRPLSTDERRALGRHANHVDCRLQWRRLISAWKARDSAAALGTFHSPAAALYLTQRLAEQVWVRSRALLRGGSARTALAH